MKLRVTLQAKLVLLALALGLGPLGAVGIVCFGQASRSLRQAAGSTLADLAFNASDKLDRNLFERYGDVQAFAKSQAARSMDPVRLDEWIDTMMRTYTPIYGLMAVADAQGRVVAESRIDRDGKPLQSASLRGLDVSAEEWFRVARGLKPDQSFVEDLKEDPLMVRAYGPTGASRALAFSAPIRDATGRVVGVWTNRFDWRVAADIVGAVEERSRAAGGATVRLVLLSASGVALYPAGLTRDRAPAPETIRHALLPHASGHGVESGAGLSRSIAGFFGLGERRMAGWYRSVGYSTYDGLGWSVVALQAETEALRDAFALMRTSLWLTLLTGLLVFGVSLVAALRVTRPLTSAAEELSRSAADLTTQSQGQATGAAEQAAAVAEVTATVEELSQTARQIAESAHQVSLSAGDSLESADTARQAVEEALTGTAALRESVTRLSGRIVSLGDKTREISKVVTLIGEIATDTHLLALNASIEAAGAGEYGRRFGVVAAEVKQLAERVVEATAEIRRMIETVQSAAGSAVTGAEEGSRTAERSSALASRSGAAIAAIVEKAHRTAELAQEISLATRQQELGSQQVAETMHQVSSVAQGSVAAGQQSADAARRLTVVAENLGSLVGRSGESLGGTRQASGSAEPNPQPGRARSSGGRSVP